MKAVRFHEFGGPETLRYENAPDPQPGPGQVLVRVRACAVNHVDLDMRENVSRFPLALPHTLGIEVAGEIAGAGRDAGKWKAGDRVTVNFILYCGDCEMCRAGNDNLCHTRRMLGVSEPGGYAQYVLAPARCVLPLPEGLEIGRAHV